MRLLLSIFWIISITLITLFLTIGCTQNLAGATTETTNGVAGVIQNSDNTPASKIIVKLFPDNYDPIFDSSLSASFIDTTDVDGSYCFKEVNSGRYVIVARDRNAKTSVLLKNIIVKDDSLTAISKGTLKKSGSILARFSNSFASKGYVYIPGTDIYALIGDDHSVLLDNVPSGIITSVILSTGNDKVNILRDQIIVESGTTTTINFPLWKYSRQIGLNTTTSGAGVYGNVYNFPVLIRLNSGNFNFLQARNDGGDLVFTSKAAKILPHQIERWDVASQCAEIWVKVDTVVGDNSAQSIFMYWGNATETLDDKRIVFDSSDGYQGVWHMGSGVEGLVHDATVNKYNGISSDQTDTKIAKGAIGNCRVFDGISDYITMPNTAQSKINFSENGFYTICAWVFLDTSDNLSHCVLSKGYEQYYLRSSYISKSIATNSPLWEFVEFGEINKWQVTNSPASIKQWVQMVGVRQGSRQLLYCNGVVVDSTIDIWPNAVSRSDINDLYIGRFSKEISIPISEGYCYFRGGIDEVRILSRAQSADWVRLCYMNQRSDDHLVEFK